MTRDVGYRIEHLKRLHRVIRQHDDLIVEALKKDMAKPKLEAYASEISLVLNEIGYALRKLPSWVKPTRVMTARPLLPSLCYTIPEPLGSVLILAPWNYPFQLALAPLVGALAAGNCAVIKPSELAPATSEVIAALLEQHFDSRPIHVVTGGPKIASKLLAQRFDHIFFTGSVRVGKLVMEAASHNLT